MNRARAGRRLAPRVTPASRRMFRRALDDEADDELELALAVSYAGAGAAERDKVSGLVDVVDDLGDALAGFGEALEDLDEPTRAALIAGTVDALDELVAALVEFRRALEQERPTQ
jgi:hypothetical protein